MKLFCASLRPRLSANFYCNSHAWHSQTHRNTHPQTHLGYVAVQIGTVGLVGLKSKFSILVSRKWNGINSPRKQPVTSACVVFLFMALRLQTKKLSSCLLEIPEILISNIYFLWYLTYFLLKLFIYDPIKNYFWALTRYNHFWN